MFLTGYMKWQSDKKNYTYSITKNRTIIKKGRLIACFFKQLIDDKHQSYVVINFIYDDLISTCWLPIQ